MQGINDGAFLLKIETEPNQAFKACQFTGNIGDSAKSWDATSYYQTAENSTGQTFFFNK